MQNNLRLWQQNIEDLKELAAFFDTDYRKNQFYRRLIIRQIFSIIESYLFVMRELIKTKISTQNLHGLTLEELFILNGESISLTDKGEPRKSPTFYNFKPSLKFTFNCFSKVFNTDKPDYSNNYYNLLFSNTPVIF